MKSFWTRRILFWWQHRCLLLLVVSPLLFARLARSTSVACSSTSECEEKLSQEGSECIQGFCSNPYHFQGCLAKHRKDHYKIRTCHSEDPASSVEKGYCRPSEFNYMEIRISTQNWESGFIIAWIFQILLSELMDVPVTVETSSPNANVDFYDQRTRFQYGNANDFDALRTSSRVKDCRLVKGDETCSHVMPEVWSAHEPELGKVRAEGVIETPAPLGALGHQMWFMRRKTAERYPEMLSYIGLRGPEARKKLASVFKRPTTWQDYCTFISLDGCQTPDDYAMRSPFEKEGGLYFLQDAYRGFFRPTEKNNCTALPETCTGHIVDYPCDWTSYVFPQAYHLGIALESNGNEPGSNGYSYSEMNQIWTAANETDSDVIMLWWRPEALYQHFMGTDSEFTVITLPPPSEECIKNRVNKEDRCSNDMDLRLGDPRGSCMEEPHVLRKVVSTAIYETSFDPELPEAMHSPAYDAIMSFRMNDLEMEEIFRLWFGKNFDKLGLDPRHAACEWVIDNLEQIQSFIPKDHPRIIVDSSDAYKEPLFYAAIVFSCFSILASSIVTGMTYYKRTMVAVRLAQIEFLFLLLVGLFLVSFAALLSALPPEDPMCVSIVWFLNLGFTLELVSLIVKVAAFQRLMVASQRMQRVKIKRVSLFGTVIIVCMAVGIALLVWTVLDPPHIVVDYTLTGNTADGQTLVERIYHCNSDSKVWEYLSVSWQLLLLLYASVLAFQTRKIRKDLNESRTLAMLIYTKFVCVILIAITYLLDGSLKPSDLAVTRSIIYNMSTMATLGIYFAPKVLFKEETRARVQVNFNGMSPDESEETSNPPESLPVTNPKHQTMMSFLWLPYRPNNPTPEKWADRGERIEGDGVSALASLGSSLGSIQRSSIDCQPETETDHSKVDSGLIPISEENENSSSGFCGSSNEEIEL